MEFLGLDDRVEIGGVAHGLLSHPGDATANGEPAILGVDLGVKESVGSDEEPALSEVSGFGPVLEIERRLEDGDYSGVGLVPGLQDVAPDNQNTALVLVRVGDDIRERRGRPRFIPELLGNRRSTGLKTRPGKHQEEAEDEGSQPGSGLS
jgi:hypothetical protein